MTDKTDETARREAVQKASELVMEALQGMKEGGLIHGWVIALGTSRETGEVAIGGCCPHHIARYIRPSIAAASDDPEVQKAVALDMVVSSLAERVEEPSQAAQELIEMFRRPVEDPSGDAFFNEASTDGTGWYV